MSNCLSPEEMASLVDGKSTPSDKKRLLRHIAECEACEEEYFFLLSLKQTAAGAGEGTHRGSSQLPDIGGIGGSGLGLGALVIPLFGDQPGEITQEPKVAGHDERNGHFGDTNGYHDHLKDSDMSNPIHNANTQWGAEGNDEYSVDVYQHYTDTCAIRSQQLILNDFGIHINQEDLMKEAANKGWYDHGTPFSDVGKLLEQHGVDVNRVDHANEYNLVNELAQGHEIIVAVHAETLWNREDIQSFSHQVSAGQADHALIVAGIDTSDADHIQVILKDPGTGDVAKAYPLDQFMVAWKGSDCYMVTTQQPAPFFAPQMVNFDYHAGHIAHIGDMHYNDFYEHFSGYLQPYGTAQESSHHLADHHPDNDHLDDDHSNDDHSVENHSNNDHPNFGHHNFDPHQDSSHRDDTHYQDDAHHRDDTHHQDDNHHGDWSDDQSDNNE